MDLSDEILEQIGTVWELAEQLRHNIGDAVDIKYIRVQLDRLRDLIDQYEAEELDTLPHYTVWLAKEVIVAGTDISDGYERLKDLSTTT